MKHPFTALIIGALALSAMADGLSLIHKDKSPAIVIDAKAPECVRFAADELHRYLWEIT